MQLGFSKRAAGIHASLGMSQEMKQCWIELGQVNSPVKLLAYRDKYSGSVGGEYRYREGHNVGAVPILWFENDVAYLTRARQPQLLLYQISCCCPGMRDLWTRKEKMRYCDRTGPPVRALEMEGTHTSCATTMTKSRERRGIVPVKLLLFRARSAIDHDVNQIRCE